MYNSKLDRIINEEVSNIITEGTLDDIGKLIAKTLAKLGKKGVLIDTDIGLRNLDVVMGLENRIVYNLVDVIEGNCRIKQALIKDKRHYTLYLLPSAQTKDKSAVSPEQMKKLADQLKEEFFNSSDIKPLLSKCKEENKGFKVTMEGETTHAAVTFLEIPLEELQEQKDL